MNYKDFKKELMEELWKKGFQTETDTALKNNATVEIIRMTRPFETTAVIYPERLFEEYNDGKMSIKEISDIITKDITTNYKNITDTKESMLNMPVSEKRKKVYLYLIGYANNKELLKTIPHKRFLDMAYVYRLYLDEKAEYTVLLNNENMEFFGFTDENDLFRTAKENTLRDYPVDHIDEDDPVFSFMIAGGLYPVTNKIRRYGFVTVLCEETLKYYTEKFGCGFYIIPSSIHEALIVSEDNGQVMEELYKICKEINDNSNVIALEEVLVTNVYYYDIETKQLNPYKADNLR